MGREGEGERERKKKILTLQQKLGTDPEVMRVVNWQMDSIRLEQQPPSVLAASSSALLSLQVAERLAEPEHPPHLRRRVPHAGEKGSLPFLPPPSLLPPPAPQWWSRGVLRESYCSSLFSRQRSRRAGSGGDRGWAPGAGGRLSADSSFWGLGHRWCRASDSPSWGRGERG